MLNNILKLKGAEELTRTAQKEIKGSGGELMACLCPSGQLVVAHGDSCREIVNQFCGLEA